MYANSLATKYLFAILIIAFFLAGCTSEPLQITGTTEEATVTFSPVPEITTATALPSLTPSPTHAETPKPAALWKTVSEQGNWVLFGMGDARNPTVVEPGTYATINFSALDNQLSGFGGCNTYSSSYTSDENGHLTISSPIASTLMACETGMEQEGVFLGSLENVTGYTITDEGYLILSYHSEAVYDEQLIFIAETPFMDTLWVLTGYGDPENLTNPKPGIITTAQFSDLFTVSGSTGCNNFFGSFSLQEPQIMINLPSINLAPCGVGTDQEQAFLDIFENVQGYWVGISALELVSADGSQVLQFSAQHLPLENVRWQLTAIDGQNLPEGLSVHMLLTPAENPASQNGENTINGSAGCNTFSGDYSLIEDTFIPGPFALTRMTCEESVMQIERTFLKGLENIQRYEIALNHLKIETQDGQMHFSADRFPLEGPRWLLTGSGPSDDPQPPGPEAIFTAEFKRQLGMPSGVKVGETGCRDYAATYFSIPHHLKVNLPSTSQNECSDAQMETEQGYFLGLNAARDYRILGNELHVYYDNSTLIFIGDHSAMKVGPLAPLNNTFWRLTSIDSTNALPQTEVTIGFDIKPDGNTGEISGLGGCNTYNAEIREVFKLGAINYTNEICESPDGVMEQENTYLDALQNATGFRYEGPNLVIETSFGDLNFISIRQEIVKPTPTPTLGALTAVIVSPKNAYPEETLRFDGSQSTPASAIQKYMWWFSDDFTAEGITVDRAFSTPGYYDVILTVFTANGERAEGSLKVNIQVPLVDTPWLLHDGSATLKFSESTLSGNAGCNDYSASYTALVAPGGPYEISIGSINVTGKTCKDEIMKKEQAFLAELATVTHYSIRATSLTLTTPKGTLNFYSAK